MIRAYKNSDLDAVLNIWLQASIKAHDFVSRGFWESQLDAMRTVYVPASENYVYEMGSGIVGFYSLHTNTLAALFVFPEYQGQGVGKHLLAHAKSQRVPLTLSVYKENQASYEFYLSQGFFVVREQVDPHTGHCEYSMAFDTA